MLATANRGLVMKGQGTESMDVLRWRWMMRTMALTSQADRRARSRNANHVLKNGTAADSRSERERY